MRINDMPELAAQVAEYMTGWTLSSQRDNFVPDALAWLHGPGLQQLKLSHARGHYDADSRIEIGVIMPKQPQGNGEAFIGATYPSPASITCAAKRGPKAIARDIQRRLLPNYPDALRATLEGYTSETARRDRQASNMALLAQVGNGRSCVNRKNVVYGHGWEAHVYTGSVRMEISLDIETAADIVAYLAGETAVIGSQDV